MKKIIDIFAQHDSFVVSGHTNPDGDCIGSCFALALTLSKMGKRVGVLLEPYPSKFNVIPGSHLLITSMPADVDVFVAVDSASRSRLGTFESAFEAAKHTVCIDHHETNVGFADVNFIEPEASSTSEMVYSIVKELVAIDTDIASAIYAGIVSDTGGFRLSLTGRSTMEVVAVLMGVGIPFTILYNELMHMHRFEAGKALGVALQNSEQHMGGRVVLTYVSLEMMAAIKANSSDLEGVVGYLMNTRDAEVAAIIYERDGDDKVKIGLRSNGANIGKVAMALGGGGHKMAAAADFDGSIEEAKAITLELIKKELTEHAV